MNETTKEVLQVKPLSRKLLAVAAYCLLLFVTETQAVLLVKSETLDGRQINYEVVLPANYDAGKPHPAVLAFAPGEQDMAMVDFTMDANYRAEAEKRGYLVFLPATPDDLLGGPDGLRRMAAFIAKLQAGYQIKDNKFNAAGMSNGGLAAFRVAASLPQHFVSVTGLPGFLQHPEPGQLEALGKLCVHLYAGETDEGWPGQSQALAATLKARGYPASFSLEQGQGHVMETLAGEGASRLFDQFDAARSGKCGG